MSEHTNPLRVEVTRGDMIESRHTVHAAIIDADGRTVESWGNTARHVYPRSAIKPLQAIPLVESGAADAFGLSPRQLALACASHLGEAIHTETVSAWLAHIGCSANDLECGGHLPKDETAMANVIRSGTTLTGIHNNCSGKHTGFLTTCQHLGEATAGYIGADHPVQQRLATLLSELGGCDLDATERGFDGCGIPVLGMPLHALARAMARMAAPDTLEDARRAAAERIFSAMTTHPEMVRGTGSFDTLGMRAGKGRFATKTGAEGVHIAIIPEKRLGIAVKVEDGNNRATPVILAALFDRLGLLEDDTRAQLTEFIETPVKNVAGKHVGDIRMAAGWQD
ncbi:MAG: asparaginase [Rhodospirillaceae bacterium]|jgi:L-asparaginase II|nr:asparaginase [Rhodospirillaceae bacterium]